MQLPDEQKKKLQDLNESGLTGKKPEKKAEEAEKNPAAIKVVTKPKRKAVKKPKDGDLDLSELDNLQALVASEEVSEEEKALKVEEKKRRAEERQRMKEYAKKAAPVIYVANRRIAELENIKKEDGVLSAADMSELKGLIAKKKPIMTKIAKFGLEDWFNWGYFIERICGGEPVKQLLQELVADGKFRFVTEEEVAAAKKPNGKWPMSTLFFDRPYTVVEQNEYYEAVYQEMRKAIKREKDVANEIANADAVEMGRLKTLGDQDLIKFDDGKAGTYVIILETGGKYQAGVGIVSVYERQHKDNPGKTTMIKIVDGAGSLKNFKVHKDLTIKFGSYRTRKVNLPDFLKDKEEFIAGAINVFKDAVRFYRGRQNRLGNNQGQQRQGEQNSLPEHQEQDQKAPMETVAA